MEFDTSKITTRLNATIQHCNLQLRVPPARRRRKSLQLGTKDAVATECSTDGKNDPCTTLDKCIICRNSECFGNKCCTLLHFSSTVRSSKIQNIEVEDQSQSSRSSSSLSLNMLKKFPVQKSTTPILRSSQCYGTIKDNNSHHHQNSSSYNSKLLNRQQQNYSVHQHHQYQDSQQKLCCCCINTKVCPYFQKCSSKTTSNKIESSNSTISTVSSQQQNNSDQNLLFQKYSKISETRFLILSILSWFLISYNRRDFLLFSYWKNTSSKCWRTFINKVPQFILWFAISLFLVNFSITLIISGAYAKEIKPRLRSSGKVCPSMDIRNNPAEFRNLSDCSVIEGFLVISLMDKYSDQDYSMSFPLLTEITDYMIVYRVNGLKTLAGLFPNLTVIRGNNLFEGNALVIYENIHLEEIALTALTTIKRGTIRIEKNPLLCFVETVNWAQIAINASIDHHFFRNNKVLNECPSCPGGNSKSENANQIDEEAHCSEQGDRRFCWNRQHCQKVCPAHCKNSCNSRLQCCNESCLGGCAPNDVNSCSVCKNLVYGNECTHTCPRESFKFLERSCITRQECFNKLPPLNADLRNEYPYVPFDGICSTQCPAGYEKVNNQTCRKCDNKCLKKCPPLSLDSLRDAQRLRGCTVITGALIINIRQGGPHLMEELENALSSIEEIEGYLKVTRSFSLVSLSFLKGLRVIRGNELDNNKYALYVLDNQNLQNIWGDNQTVLLERGRIFFHFNPKLCYYKIENLRSMMVENGTLDKAEVATDSNGDRGSCNITTLNVTVTQIGPRAAIVKVQPMEFEDDRGFIGYQYYYIEAPFKNVSMYDIRHGCGSDGWNLDDDNSKDTDHIFTHLKPYTQYAFYVKTYTISTETNNGQSPIIYFRTKPDKPEPVRNLRSITNSSSEVIVKWLAPKVANGNLTMYVIKANLTLDDPKLLEQRNYCDEPIKEIFEVPTIIHQDGKSTGLVDRDGKDCACDDKESRVSKSSTKDNENDVVNAIDFEDAIQNFIYVKREESDEKNVRRKRDLENITMTTTDISDMLEEFPKERPKEESNRIHSHEIDPKDMTLSRRQGKFYTYTYEIVNTSITEIVLKHLKHYSMYTVSVKACREGEGDRCSSEAISYSRTMKLGGADNVENLSVEVATTNTSRSDVRLKWEPPRDPNGLIVSYSIRYARADIEHAKGVDQCITHHGYQNLSNRYFVLTSMETGNYSVQVMATSLAGDGNYTTPLYFYIPEKSIGWQVITAICFTVLLLFVLIGILIWYIKKKYLAPVPDLKLFTSVNPEYVSMHYTPDEWEIPRDKIIHIRELGQGSFGMVYEGIVKNLNKSEDDTPCAIKTVNESATDRERINFLNEASVMKEFDTHHVVRLLGVCSRGQPTLVVMELMKNGDLKAYLRSHRPDAESLTNDEIPPQPPTLKRILQMAIEIADGMAYLSAKKFVHRDLAARNCMVAADLTVKIGDFGMTRDIYETDYYRKGTKGLLPVRWMAPESLKDGVFSSASDIFSYGVVLWEMATLASQPYQGLSNDQVLRYVIDGGVMERPENCPDKLYNLMRKCWQHRPSSRPTFIDIIQSLLDDADSNFRDVSFFHSQEGQDILAQMQPPTDLDDVTTPLRVGDDDFKMEIEDNYLNNSKHSRRSHLAAAEGQPHSPYSFGSAVLTSSTPGVSSLKRSSSNTLSSSLNQKQQQQQNPKLLPQEFESRYYPTSVSGDIQSPTTAAAASTSAETAPIGSSGSATAATPVQNFINNLSSAPRSRRMEFLRNAFLGNSNSNNGNHSSSKFKNNGGNGGGNILYGKKKGFAGTVGATASNPLPNVNPNEYNNGKNGNSRKTSKDYQILNESAISADFDGDGEELKSIHPTQSSSIPSTYNYEQLSLPSLFSLDKRTQQPKQQKQCNEIDCKVTNSLKPSNKLSHSISDSCNSNSSTDKETFLTTAPPYHIQQQSAQQQQQQQQQKQQKYQQKQQNIKNDNTSSTPSRSQVQQPNGYIVSSLQPDYSFSQDFQDSIPEEQKLLTKSHK